MMCMKMDAAFAKRRLWCVWGLRGLIDRVSGRRSTAAVVQKPRAREPPGKGFNVLGVLAGRHCGVIPRES